MADTRPHARMADARSRLILPGTGKAKAQELARGLVAENAQLMRVLGAALERTGPLELPCQDTEEGAGVLGGTAIFEIERYDSTDGLSARWVSKRVR